MAEDRLAGPIHSAIKLIKPYNLIMNVIEAAISFHAIGENGKYLLMDEKFFIE